MMEKEAYEAKKDDTAYMSDELGQEIFTCIVFWFYFCPD